MGSRCCKEKYLEFHVFGSSASDRLEQERTQPVEGSGCQGDDEVEGTALENWGQ